MKLRFMKYRKLSYWISGVLVALSVLSLANLADDGVIEGYEGDYLARIVEKL